MNVRVNPPTYLSSYLVSAIRDLAPCRLPLGHPQPSLRPVRNPSIRYRIRGRQGFVQATIRMPPTFLKVSFQTPASVTR